VTNEPTTLYRLYDANDRLLYIGITNRPEVRFRTHAANQAWWSEVVRSSLCTYATRAAAAAAEAQAIATETPLYNVLGVPGRRPRPRRHVVASNGLAELAIATDPDISDESRRVLLAMLEAARAGA
jgi:predicted GIY-YIG superfamily endonuclease